MHFDNLIRLTKNITSTLYLHRQFVLSFIGVTCILIAIIGKPHSYNNNQTDLASNVISASNVIDAKDNAEYQDQQLAIKDYAASTAFTNTATNLDTTNVTNVANANAATTTNTANVSSANDAMPTADTTTSANTSDSTKYNNSNGNTEEIADNTEHAKNANSANNTDSDYAATHDIRAISSATQSNITSAPISANKTLSLDNTPASNEVLAIPDVVEDYTPLNSPTKAASTNIATEPKWRIVKVAGGDTMAKIFARLSISKNILHKIIASDPNGKYLANLHLGQEIKFQFDHKNNLLGLQFIALPHKIIHIKYGENGYSYKCDEQKITTKLAYKENSIKDSLFASAQSVSLNDKTILQFADIFSWDIDFAMDIREDDSFRILYEEKYINDKKIGTGNILMAEFVNQNHTYRAIRFTDKNGHTGYYTPEGYGMQKAFLRNPVKFTRISSYFSHNRAHPILHRIRAHKGVDYAAPAGTPVEAAGNGKVVFIGNKNGYGQSIELQHGNKYSTFYAHLSRFAKGIKNGSNVKQGQIIGYVGRTGLATGDHLHYEFRVDGIHRDPLTVKLPRSMPIDRHYRREFNIHASNMFNLLNKHNKEYLAKR